jgi:hypothetical protein
MNHDEHQHLNTKEGKKPGEAKADLKKLQVCLINRDTYKRSAFFDDGLSCILTHKYFTEVHIHNSYLLMQHRM